mgnify:CR=1 FL=1
MTYDLHNKREQQYNSSKKVFYVIASVLAISVAAIYFSCDKEQKKQEPSSLEKSVMKLALKN